MLSLLFIICFVMAILLLLDLLGWFIFLLLCKLPLPRLYGTGCVSEVLYLHPSSSLRPSCIERGNWLIARNVFIFHYLRCYDHLKFHAQ